MSEATNESLPNGTPSFFDFNHAADCRPPAYDRDEIRSHLLERLDSVLAYLFPNGKRRGAQFFVGNLQGDAGDSLVIELDGPKRGLWLDFATGECGDVFELWASVRGFDAKRGFAQLLDNVGQWLAVPRPTPVVSSKKSGFVYDELGPRSAKWDYLDAAGQLLACVYRYDTPDGKQYRPWDARAGAMRMPDPRPLYNLPAVVASATVVLVEGEKCADALMQLGIVATTAMGGAATAIDKTDWSPLAGKAVTIWPDNDEAGAKYASAVTPTLHKIGAQLRQVVIPSKAPKKWDAADAVAEGFDVEGLLRSAAGTKGEKPKHFDLSEWHAVDRFIGEPRARQWLVQGVFPMAQAALVAAGGGVGKSFLLLSLARHVAAFDGSWIDTPVLFGGALAGHGTAIYVTAEDDAIEVHNRLRALGTIPNRLYVLPLPDAGGAVALFAPDPSSRGPSITSAWVELDRQLKGLAGLSLVVLDPLQPLCALDLNVPENAQFVCSRLAALAASTGASVIVSHHFAKREASNPEQAREAIRGTGGLVDGVRAVYALWNPREDEARRVSNTLGVPHQRGSVVMGGIVKANGRANLRVTTYLRDETGLLIDRSDDVVQSRRTTQDLLPALKDAIARAAIEGRPYTKTGGNGPYERRHELPEAFHVIGKHRLTEWVSTLLEQGQIVAAMVDSSKMVKWLDEPNGPVATGQARFRLGHMARSQSGRTGIAAEDDGTQWTAET